MSIYFEDLDLIHILIPKQMNVMIFALCMNNGPQVDSTSDPLVGGLSYWAPHGFPSYVQWTIKIIMYHDMSGFSLTNVTLLFFPNNHSYSIILRCSPCVTIFLSPESK